MSLLLVAAGVVLACLAVAAVVQGVTTSADSRRRTTQARAAADAQELELIRSNPPAFLRLIRRRLRVAQQPVQAGLDLAREQLREDDAAVARVEPVRHRGVALAVRLASAAAFVTLVALGALLSVEIFVALNDGAVDPASVAKGIAAAGVELLLTLYITEQFRGGWSTPDWSRSMMLALAVALLLLTVGLVTFYADARSQHAFADTLRKDRLDVTQAEAARKRSDTALTQASVTAANDKLAADEARLLRAGRSDQALAMLIPAVSAATGPLGVDGLVLIGAQTLISRRSMRRRESKRAVSASEAQLAALQAKFDLEAEQTLRAAGVLELPDVAAPPRPVPPPPVPPPVPPSVPSVIDLTRFPSPTPSATPTQPDPWDL